MRHYCKITLSDIVLDHGIQHCSDLVLSFVQHKKESGKIWAVNLTAHSHLKRCGNKDDVYFLSFIEKKLYCSSFNKKKLYCSSFFRPLQGKRNDVFMPLRYTGMIYLCWTMMILVLYCININWFHFH